MKFRLRRDFIKEKSSIVKLPFSIRFQFRKKNFYLLPQAWWVQDSLSNVRYNENDRYTVKHYLVPTEWHFTWLCFDIHLELRKFYQSEQELIHPNILSQELRQWVTMKNEN